MSSIILGCPTIQYELKQAMTDAHCDIPVYFIPQQIHNSPPTLQKYLQRAIDNLWNVDRIYICVSACGGGTAGLTSPTAELVLPRTRDCVDILLSSDSLESLDRPMDACFFTRGWADFNRNSEQSIQKLTEKKGYEYAKSYVQQLYDGFNKFYYVDTGLNHLPDIHDMMDPLVEALDGSITTIPGHYGILKKIANGTIDEDFMVVAPNQTVESSAFMQWF
ncbi:MAG: DUF1638 domain-containing protein [Veillonella sp.]|nr:DUF1638 domain-containing protein [Veillonella sp.]